MNGRKKIVVLTDWFFPAYKAGGPIQSCINFSLIMKEKYDIYIVSGNTDLGEITPLNNIVSDQWTTAIATDIHVYYFSKAELNYKNLVSVISNLTPDFIYLNHMYSVHFVIFPLWAWWNGRLKSKVILCPRGALYDSALHYKRTYLKKIIFLKFFRWTGLYKNIFFHATNEQEKEAIERFFPTDKIKIANNLPNGKRLPFQSLEKKRSFLKCVFIARIVPLKNLLFLLNVLKEIKAMVTLTIVGPNEDERYWNECIVMIKQLPKNISVNYVGAVANDALYEILICNHLYILPSSGENFGHSIFEAFLAGRPVLISDQTPWRDLISKKVGWDLSLTGKNSYISAVEEALAWGQEEFDERSFNAWSFAENFLRKSTEIEKYERLFS